MNERELELVLRTLGERLRAAPTTDLAPGVVRVLESTRARGRPRRRVTLAVAAVLLVVCAAAVAATPPLRDAVRDWLSSAGVGAQTVDRLPPTVPVAEIAELGLGRRADAAQARRILGVPLPRSPLLGSPDLIFTGAASAGASVTLLWRASNDLRAAADLPAVGALLTLAPTRDRSAPWWIAKSLGPGSHAEFVDLAGIPGAAVWIEGAPHTVTGLDGRTARFRLAANVLVWRLGDRVYRLESALGRSAAEQVATTLRTRAQGG